MYKTKKTFCNILLSCFLFGGVFEHNNAWTSQPVEMEKNEEVFSLTPVQISDLLKNNSDDHGHFTTVNNINILTKYRDNFISVIQLLKESVKYHLQNRNQQQREKLKREIASDLNTLNQQKKNLLKVYPKLRSKKTEEPINLSYPLFFSASTPTIFCFQHEDNLHETSFVLPSGDILQAALCALAHPEHPELLKKLEHIDQQLEEFYKTLFLNSKMLKATSASGTEVYYIYLDKSIPVFKIREPDKHSSVVSSRCFVLSKPFSGRWIVYPWTGQLNEQALGQGEDLNILTVFPQENILQELKNRFWKNLLDDVLAPPPFPLEIDLREDVKKKEIYQNLLACCLNQEGLDYETVAKNIVKYFVKKAAQLAEQNPALYKKVCKIPSIPAILSQDENQDVLNACIEKYASKKISRQKFFQTTEFQGLVQNWLTTILQENLQKRCVPKHIWSAFYHMLRVFLIKIIINPEDVNNYYRHDDITYQLIEDYVITLQFGHDNPSIPLTLTIKTSEKDTTSLVTSKCFPDSQEYTKLITKSKNDLAKYNEQKMNNKTIQTCENFLAFVDEKLTKLNSVTEAINSKILTEEPPKNLIKFQQLPSFRQNFEELFTTVDQQLKFFQDENRSIKNKDSAKNRQTVFLSDKKTIVQNISEGQIETVDVHPISNTIELNIKLNHHIPVLHFDLRNTRACLTSTDAIKVFLGNDNDGKFYLRTVFPWVYNEESAFQNFEKNRQQYASIPFDLLLNSGKTKYSSCISKEEIKNIKNFIKTIQ